MNPSSYFYRNQALVVYRQPVGKDYADADVVAWCGSMTSAAKVVAELERLREENLELQKNNQTKQEQK